MSELKDLTLDGRLTVHPLVSEAKVNQVASMIEKASKSPIVRAELKELISTSDALFSSVHLMNMRNLPEYDRAERKWQLISETVPVENFRKIEYGSLSMNFADLQYASGEPGIAPVIPEGSTYPYAFGWTTESVDAQLRKRGFKVGVTLEAIVNDITGLLTRLPGEMIEAILDTQEFVIYNTLINGVTSASGLQAATTPSGASVPVNSAFNRDALIAAFIQAGQRKVNGRNVPLASSYYLVVASGAGVNAEFELNKRLVGMSNGSAPQYDYSVVEENYAGRVAGVIEAEWVQSGYWYLVPAAGTTRRPSLLDLRLLGHESPELHVKSNSVPYAGAPSYGLFGHLEFDTDTTDIRVRDFFDGALLSEDQIVWSKGTGSA